MSTVTTGSPGPRPQFRTKAQYSQLLAPYRRSSVWHSVGQVTVTAVFFVVCWIAAYRSLTVSYLLTMLWAIPAAALVVRLFCIMHDCGHGSFFRSRRANDLLGAALGVLACTPYRQWSDAHAVHHATSGNLDRRGEGGEIHTMTVREYYDASPRTRLLYRLYRHPLILFGIGPAWHFLVRQRYVTSSPHPSIKERASVLWTNAALVVVAGLMCLIVGPWDFLRVHAPIAVLSSSIGVWLFYIQHQYEDAYWRHEDDWNGVQAALDGSSYYRLPRVLEWFTASIGLHHIHHLDSKIPNYRLHPCLDENPEFQDVRQISLWDSLGCMRLKLWDEQSRRLVSFAEARKIAGPAASAS